MGIREKRIRVPIPLKNAILFSALGARTFTPEQVRSLRKALDVRFVRCLWPLAPDQFVTLARPYSIIGLTRRTLRDIGPDILDRLPLLEGIAIYATGFEWIDREYLRRRRIKLFTLPDYSTTTVAEHAWGCLLALSRRIHLSFDKTRGLVPSTVSLRGMELSGKTIGVIGYGRIGKAVARRARAFGMKVLWTDPKRRNGPGKMGLGSLLRRSDAIVLSCPQRRGEGALLDAGALRMAKKGSILVNVSRGSLVEDKAILRSIREGRVFGYAVDDDHPGLRAARGIEPGRILQTNHTAWYSNEAIRRGTQAWVDRLAALGRGRATR